MRGFEEWKKGREEVGGRWKMVNRKEEVDMEKSPQNLGHSCHEGPSSHPRKRGSHPREREVYWPPTSSLPLK